MYWLLYDISDNRRRNKLAQICKDYGLVRMQKSCFYGKLEGRGLNRFQGQLDRLLQPEDQVLLIPISRKSVLGTKIWGDGNVQILDTDVICFC